MHAWVYSLYPSVQYCTTTARRHVKVQQEGLENDGKALLRDLT